MTANSRRQNGFTLIEVLVSMALLAVLSMFSYQVVDVVMKVNERSRDTMASHAQLQRAWQIIGRDLMHLRPRTFADGLGATEPAYITNPSDFGIRFSRGGGPMIKSNPSGVRRVVYEINQHSQLIRTSWAITDSPRQTEGTTMVLLDNVDKVELNHLDKQKNYSIDWPPLNTSVSQRSLPRMISVTITTTDQAVTSRLFPGAVIE